MLPMAAAFGIQAGTAALGAVFGNKQANEAYINGLQQNQSENLAIQEANLTNTIRTGYRVGILNVQRGKARMQAVAQGTAVSQDGLRAAGAASANAAASGSYGASVDAVRDEIDQKVEKAQGDVTEGWRQMQDNMDVQLNDIITAGTDAIQSARTMNYSGKAPGTQDPFEAMVTGAAKGAASFATDYAISSYKLGLGTKGTK